MASASDKTVNKIAICSAIFAGVAYVGYSYVKNAFSRSLKKTKRNGTADEGKNSRGNSFLDPRFIRVCHVTSLNP